MFNTFNRKAENARQARSSDKTEKKLVTPTILALMLFASGVGSFYRLYVEWSQLGVYTSETLNASIGGFIICAVLILAGSLFANKTFTE